MISEMEKSRRMGHRGGEFGDPGPARLNAFLDRCQSLHGVNVRMRRGHMISDVRTQVVSRESVEHYRDNVHAPALRMVKERHALRGSKMTLEHKGNFDEWMLDLNAFVSANAYLDRRPPGIFYRSSPQCDRSREREE